MLSSNNHSEQIKKQMQKQQRFAIKKLTVGVASVLVGLSFMGITQNVHADVNNSAQQMPTTEKQVPAANANKDNQAANTITVASQMKSAAQSGATSVTTASAAEKSAASSSTSSAANKSVASEVASSAASSTTDKTAASIADKKATSSAASDAQNSSAAKPFVVLASSDATKANDDLANYAGVHFVFEDANGNPLDAKSLTYGQDFDKDSQDGFYDKSNLYEGYDLATKEGQTIWNINNALFDIQGYKLVNAKDVVAQMVPGSTAGSAAFKMGTTVTLKYAPFADTVVEVVDKDTGKVVNTSSNKIYGSTYHDASLTYMYTHKEDANDRGYSQVTVYAPYTAGYEALGEPIQGTVTLDDSYPVQTVNADGTVNPNTNVYKFYQYGQNHFTYTLHYVNALTNKPLDVKSKMTYGNWVDFMPDNSTVQLKLSGTKQYAVFNEIVNMPGYKLVNYQEVMNKLSYDPSKGGLPMAQLPTDITLKYAPLSPILVVYKDSSNGKTIWSGVYPTDDLVDTSIQYRLGNTTAASAPRYVVSPLQLNGYKLAAGQGTVTGYIDDDFPTQTLSKDGTLNPNYKTIVITYDPMDNAASGVDEHGHAYGQNHELWTHYTDLSVSTDDGTTRLPGSFNNNANPYHTYAQNGSDPDGNFQKQVDLIKPIGWNYGGSTGFVKNSDYANDMIKTRNYFTPNQPVFVNYYDTEGKKLADTVTLQFNANNPDQSNDGINGVYVPYGNWTAPQKNFNGYTMVKTEGATSGQFNSFTYTVNFIYAADTTGKVSYIDDTDGETLRTDDLSGVAGQSIKYTTADKIKGFEAKGLKLVSNNFKDGQQTFADNVAGNTFEVHFKHASENKDQTQQIKETIHYVYADGSQAAPDKVATVEFKRTNTVDQHNGKVTDGTWTPDSQTFAEVASPDIPNCTPSKASIPAQTVHQGDDDLVFTVIYSRDAVKGQVKYIDDTTGKQLDADSLNGKVGEAIDYTTAGKIKDLENQGLTFVSNNFTDGHETFNKDANKNDFEVHFKHATTQSTDNKVVSETIHYVYEDGSEASPDFLGTIQFSRNATYDKYTKQTTYGDWFADTGTFNEVVSPTIKGYKANISSIAARTVTPNSEDKTFTVIYSQQATKGELQYVDLTANRVLAVVPLNGNIGDPIDYTTAGEIANYEKQGLVLFHNDFKDGQENFAKNEGQNFFEVQFKHAFKDSQENRTVKQIIHYVYADGSKAADDYTAHIDFSRTKHTDLYTGDTNFTRYTPWTPEVGQFDAVKSPVIANYTPDMAVVPAMGEYAGNPDYVMTVTYTRDAAQGMVTYYDDTTGIQLRQDSLSGKAGQAIDYTTAAKVAQFENDGYKLVSNGFTDGNETFVAGDHNNFEVHFKHDQETVNNSKTVKETIHYQFADGTKAADDATADVTFKQTNTVDSVDRYVLKEGAWTPASHEFAAVKSPAIKGYTPDYVQVAARNVTPTSNDFEITVTYIKATAAGRVTYIDDTTHQTLRTDALDGHAGEAIDYTTADKIKGFKDQGLTLVSNGFHDGNEIFADDVADNTFEVHFKHDVTTANESKDVKETIHYVYADGTKAADDHTATIKFSRTNTTDHYTGKTTSNDWTADNNQFAAVVSPTIANYTPDKVQVAAVTVTPNDKDVDVTVTYTRDAANGTVTYIDDTTNHNLAVDTFSGKAGDAIDYTTAGKIADFEKQGLKLVSNGFKDGHETYNKDSKKNSFEVHFVHQLKNVNETKTINETIHYQYADGKKAADDHTAHVNFSRTDTVDQYTGKTTKAGVWTPANGQFATVQSPKIAGYTPDLVLVASRTVDPTSADLDLTVTYMATPVQPTTPVNPSTTPTTPVNPSTTPTTPVNPSTTPTTPVNPSTTPTTPVNPSTTPTTPVNPSTTPTTPVNPSTTPTTPVNPSTTPTTPVNPSTTPTTPVNPSTTPTTPNQPSSQGSTTPVNPSQPSQPTNPSTPNVPSSQGTTTPNEPNEPVEPNQPAQPTTPNQPSPAGSTTPNMPNEPAEPAQPSQVQPAEPAQPVAPAQPAAPQTPAANKPSAASATEKLPQTGNDQAKDAAMAGLGLAAILGFFGLGKRRRND